MDIAWFPFDEQYCSIVFESWIYGSESVILKVPNTDPIGKYNYEPNGLWEVVGKYRLSDSIMQGRF